MKHLVLSANSYATNNGNNALERKSLREAFKAGAAWAQEPEPLDPHTCELCVGDVVKYIGDTVGLKGKYVEIEDITTTYFFKGHPFSISKKHGRDSLILIQRAGVQIGEK